MITELQTCLNEVINSVHEATIDKLDNKFNFVNIGCFFTVQLSGSSGGRNTFNLLIYLISQQNNKIEMQKVSEDIDSVINNCTLTCNAIIRHPDIWVNEFIDDDKLQNIILTYKVDQF